jgi:lactate dehydrogenase-like 2-hydroxyacid dehydrogenase
VSQARVFVTRALPDAPIARLVEADVDVHVGPVDAPSRDLLLAEAAESDALLSFLTEQIDAPLIDASPRLKVIANCAVGYDNIDLAAATSRGIVVTNTPGVLDRATADLAFGLILDLSRRISESDRFVRTGSSWIWGPQLFVGLDVSAGATLGIVGLGRIGAMVARRARAFDMEVIATRSEDMHRGTDADTGVKLVPLPELLERSDIVTLHCPLTDRTRHLIDAAALAAMKASALLVNTARGPIVDEDALVRALTDGTIAGAALDVFEREPLVDPRLLALDNVVLTPHTGSAGRRTRLQMADLAARNVIEVLSGRVPLTPVPPV